MNRLWEEENKKYQDKPNIIDMDDRNKKFMRMEKAYGRPLTKPDLSPHNDKVADRMYKYAQKYEEHINDLRSFYEQEKNQKEQEENTFTPQKIASYTPRKDHEFQYYKPTNNVRRDKTMRQMEYEQ